MDVILQSLLADLDGDGHLETVQTTLASSIQVLRAGVLMWSAAGPIDGWKRNASDVVVTKGLDVDSDGKQEVFIFNSNDGWIGLLKWRDDHLTCLWATGDAELDGPAGTWNRRPTDAFGITDWQGTPAVSISHDEDEWYGTLAWDGSRLALVVLWHGGLNVRKFVFLFDTIEATGVVDRFKAAAFEGHRIAPEFGLKLDAGFHSVIDSVLGVPASEDDARMLHCESYPQGISDVEWNGDTQINATMKAFEPWGFERFSGDNGGAPVEMTTAAGTRRAVVAGDRIRVKGRLIIENGHATGGPPGFPIGPDGKYRSGRPWVELHPYDWRGIVEDPLPTDSTGVSTHNLLLIAPLYEAVEMRDRRNPVYPDQIDRLVTVNASPATFHNSVSTSNDFAAPPSPPVPVPLQYTETVLVNKTGRPIEELRTLTVGSDHISVTARVDAIERTRVGPFSVADPNSIADDPNAAVLLVQYKLAWGQLPRRLSVPAVFVNAGPGPSTVIVEAYDEAGSRVDADVVIDGAEIARTFQSFDWSFSGHRVRHVEVDDKGHPHVTWTWTLDPTNVLVRATGFPDTTVTVASNDDV